MTLQDEDIVLKILHTADWHLGMRFPSFGDEDQLTLMRARMDVIDRILGAAQRGSVDAVLCAGDLFDDPQPHEDWWRGLVEKLSRMPPRPVFLLPGNHDPLTNTSVYHSSHPFRRALPQWVHVVDRDDFEAQLSDDAVLIATPCRSSAGKTDLWRQLPGREPGDERIRIGMLHGQTFDEPAFQTTFPIAKDAAETLGLDYLAIGDTHAFREVPPGSRFPTVYPGAPEPTKFGEHDAGNVALVFFPRGRRRAMIRREGVGRWRWVERTCDSLDSLRALAADDDLRRTVLRLKLELSVRAEAFAEAEAILRRLAGTSVAHGRVGVLQVDRSGLDLDTAEIDTAFEGLPQVLQAAVEQLRAQEGGAQGEQAKRALYHLFRLLRAEAKGP